jgi:hypothetical protein
MRRFLLSLVVAACLTASTPAFAQQAMSAAAMPTCASGDPVVWVNTSTKKYHMQGDAYYGKTKHGKYLCKSAADAKSYKLAGSHASADSAAAPDAGSSPAASGAMNGGMMTSKKHKHHHGGMASPSPDASASPAAN